MTKSVVEVASSGFWFWSSLTSRLRKSLDVSVELDDVLDDDDVVVAVDAELVAETVIRKLRLSRAAGDKDVGRRRLKSVC